MSFHVNTSVRSCVFWKKKKQCYFDYRKAKKAFSILQLPCRLPLHSFKKKKTYRELTDNKISVPKASYLMLSAASPEDFQALGTTECSLLKISVTCCSYLWTASENVYNLLSKLMNHPCWTRFPGGITILPLALRAMTWCRIAGRVLHLTVPPTRQDRHRLRCRVFHTSQDPGTNATMENEFDTSPVLTIFSDICVARLFPPRTAAVVQSACALRTVRGFIRDKE